jgi:class 3 adenylate cyclase/predicted ATPase/ABC-type transport system involved in cytochrome c biogenesis ATPase subunit
MPSVSEWLASLGLAEYADRFAEHRIDFSILRDLTDRDLKEELGIMPLGDRRKLLRAIASLDDPSSATSLLAPQSDLNPRDEAERRQVTVMFADLVGSTALSREMDPEDLREVISAYQKCVAETVRQLGGFVARYLGDAVLVYFGYPHAREDDAERAVRAGLELISLVTRLKTRTPLQVRIGIATGLVVVGHLIPSGESEERGIIGDTPNIAARLQSIAEPNMVVIAESTRRLLGSFFQVEELEARSLKGISGPTRAWAVLQASSVASRFEALHPISLTALVGREEEFELLRQRWLQAKNGEGQVVLLSGDAGIGKSRLIASFVGGLADKPHARLRYFCSPQHTDSALYPIIRQMEHAAGLKREDTLQAKFDKLDELLKGTSTSAQDASLFAEMLLLPTDGRYPALELTAQQRRRRTLEALALQIEALARSCPVLMIFEDAHWSDPTSLELLGMAVDRIRALRVLLIVTFRPEYEPDWIDQPHVTQLRLDRLAPREVAAMISHIVGNKPLPANIQQDIIERTDGVPLFVEEMTKAMLEAESEGEAQLTAAMIPSSAIDVPATLHASLMARLDRLGSAKELAQIGAAIGREFSDVLLTAVARKPKAELRAGLDRLIGAGLLLRQGEPPQPTYFFKHALVRDAAYSTLLREPRRALHARIVEALETQFAEISEKQPELLARHCTEAGQIEKAAGLWGKAGMRSAQRSALVEAAEQLRHALDQIATLSPTPALRREQIKLQVTLITPLLHVRGYAAAETRAAVERARLLIQEAEAVGESPEDPLLLFSVLYGFWVANLVAFNGDVMCELSTQFLALANKQNATGPLMMGHRIVGLSLLHTGDVRGGRAHLDRAVALYDPAEHRPLATRFGQDVGAATLSWRSLAFWLLGYPQAALADSEHALKVAREVGHSATLMYVLNFSVWTHILCGDYAAANTLVAEFSSLRDQTGSSFWAAWGMMQRGYLLAHTGKTSDAVQTVTSGVSAMRSTGTTMWMPLWLSCLAGAMGELGQLDDARRCIGEAMTGMEASKERWCEAEVNRIAGEIELASSKPNLPKADSYFARALVVAREQQAKSWELRVAMSMARLRRDQGVRSQARDLLGSAYGCFTEGFHTLDLKKAKALFDELAGDNSSAPHLANRTPSQP